MIISLVAERAFDKVQHPFLQVLERSNMWSKGNMSPLLVEIQTWAIILEINLAFSRNFGNTVSEGPAVLLLNIKPKDASP